MSIFTDFVLVRSPCLFVRSRPAIHRWKALIAKEKRKERKGGEKEGDWDVFGADLEVKKRARFKGVINF